MDMLLNDWPVAAQDLDPARSDRCVHELFEEQARRTPEAVAVMDGVRRLGYGELNSRANQLAHHLRALGVGPETLVGACLPRSAELLVALLGVLKAGGAYLPLDPGHPSQRIGSMLADSGAPVLVSTVALAGRLGGFGARMVCLDADAAALAGQPADNPVRLAGGDNLAYVIYTSGSTGTPKGVMVHHAGLANFIRWCVQAYARYGPGGAPLFSSAAFDMIVPDLYTPLVLGQPVHVVPESVPPLELGGYLARRGPFSFIKLTPGHLDLLAQQLDRSQARGLARQLVVGADTFPPRILQLWRELDPDTPVLNEYGPTEASVANCVHALDQFDPGRSIPIGRPIPNTTMYVLDERLRPVPDGGVGELYIGGACVARGYLGRPGLTAERFVPDPFAAEAGARLYRTGDLGRFLDDGALEFLGRVDHQIKIRGFRIEPGEIESHLVQHPRVRHAVVSAVGDGHRQLVAYVVADGEPPTAQALRAHLRPRLPDYMLPARFVPIEALPLDRNGKLDRKALPDPGPTPAG